MNRESFIFYRSFYNAISALPDDQQLCLYRAVTERALNGIDPDLSGAVKGMYELIKPQIEANERKYLNGCKGAEFGKLGGRPPKNPTETPKKPLNYPTETPNDNVNENENYNDNYSPSVSPPAPQEEEEPPEKKSYGSEFKKVKLTDAEYEKLIERLGYSGTEDYIDRLDGYLAEGHRKKNHYATILNWWRRDNSKKETGADTTASPKFTPSTRLEKTKINFKPSRI